MDVLPKGKGVMKLKGARSHGTRAGKEGGCKGQRNNMMLRRRLGEELQARGCTPTARAQGQRRAAQRGARRASKKQTKNAGVRGGRDFRSWGHTAYALWNKWVPPKGAISQGQGSRHPRITSAAAAAAHGHILHRNKVSSVVLQRTFIEPPAAAAGSAAGAGRPLHGGGGPGATRARVAPSYLPLAVQHARAHSR